MKRVKPFTLLGTVVMSLGVYLLTTLDVSSTPATVVLYLMVTGLGLLGQVRIACGLYSPKCLVRAFSAVHLQEFGFVGGFGSLFCRVTKFLSAGLCSACPKSTKGY